MKDHNMPTIVGIIIFENIKYRLDPLRFLYIENTGTAAVAAVPFYVRLYFLSI